MKGLRFVLLMMLWATFGRVSTLAQHSPLVNAFPRLSFFKPTFITHATDGSDRLFVVQQNGIIKVFLNDSSMSVASTFLDLSHKISSYSGEEGLLGLAFHPNFRQNGFIYVSYTRFKPGTHAMQVVISRFSVSPVDANRADSLSEYFLLTNDKPSDGGVVQSNHNGGMLSFGPDGFLYIGTGDGGSANDPWNNAQNLSVLLGKILRIDVDHGLPYAIPPDNPYAGNTNGWKGEIWAYGLRNPWRFSFDSLSGRLWAGDVGQDTREEIDLITKGGNYGWRVMEGSIFRPGGGKGDSTGLIMPLADYDHTQGEAVIGGYVYRGHRRPDLVGQRPGYLQSGWHGHPHVSGAGHGPVPVGEMAASFSSRSPDLVAQLHLTHAPQVTLRSSAPTRPRTSCRSISIWMLQDLRSCRSMISRAGVCSCSSIISWIRDHIPQ